MSKLKPLHLASSLEELNKKVDSSLIKGATPRVLCKMADKILLKAKDESLSGDQEQAYILYMRFVDAVKVIRASKEYKKDKKDLDKLLPSSKILEAVEGAERLSQTLKERYSDLQSEEVDEDQVVPVSASERPISEQDSGSMVKAKSNKPLVAIPPSTPHTLPSLTPTQLYTILTSTPSQVIVIDCRPRASYNSSHPDSKRFPQWFSVPQEAIMKGVTDQSVILFLKPSIRPLWKDRANKKYVVLVDESSTLDDLRDHAPKDHAPIISLRDALVKFEMTDPLTPPNPYILEGGFAMWHLSYAVTCTGVYRKPPLSQRSEVKLTKVESTETTLDYPTFDMSEPMEMTSDPSSVSIDMDNHVAMETVTPNNQSYQSPVVFQSVVEPSFVPTYPSAPLPTFAPLPPAPPVPLSLEGESELLAPSLSEDFIRDMRPLEEMDPLPQDQQTFGIVAEQAVISTLLPGGYTPIMYPHQEVNRPRMVPPMSQEVNRPGMVPPMSQEVNRPGMFPPMSQEVNRPGIDPPMSQEVNRPGMVPPMSQEVNRPGMVPPMSHNQMQYPPQESSMILNRIVEGSIPNPPTYDQSHSLPAMPPTQAPIPPPMSLGPNQPNQFQNQSNQFLQTQSPATQNLSVQFDQTASYLGEKDARIQELEARLANSERTAHENTLVQSEARRLQEGQLASLQEQVEQERVRIAFEAKKNSEQVELARQELVKEREMAVSAIEAEKRALAIAKEQAQREIDERSRNLAVMKEQFDKERAMMEAAAKQKQLNSHLEQRRREEQQRVFSLQSGLPQNWQKRLDPTTGRFYYVDHETKTTHWNPPTNWINYQRAKQEENERRNQPIPSTASPRQPQATPPVQTPPQGTNQPKVPQPTPSVDRSSKPEATPTQPVVPDRSKKPTSIVAKQPPIKMTPARQIQKKQNLQAVFGTRRHVLTGLRNLGNTCFMNSTLQCLASVTPVIKYFLSGTYQDHINTSNPLGSRGEIAIEFAWLMKALWSGGYKSVSPRDFKDMIGSFVPQMKGSDQQDAQEFLAFLLDGLHEDLNMVKKKVYIAENDNGNRDDNQAAEQAWNNHLRRNDSIIVKYFQGMFRSSIRCTNCGKSSVTFEPFMYLSLPIPPGQGEWSLEDCVKLFIKSETVEWNCSNCKDPKCRAVKKMDIWRLPPILLVHLKRFTYQGMWRDKRHNKIDYPTKSNLDMSRYLASQQSFKSFSLFGVCNHFGTMTGGHYTACCRNPYNGTFYNFDDHDVKDALPRQLKSSAAYILYFSAIDLTPGKFNFER